MWANGSDTVGNCRGNQTGYWMGLELTLDLIICK